MAGKSVYNPPYVAAAFRHVRNFIPDITSVRVSQDSWLFRCSDGRTPSFEGHRLNVSLFEKMLDGAYVDFHLPITFDYKPEEDFIDGTIYVVYWNGQAVGGFDWYPSAEGALKNYRTTLETGCSATLVEHTLPKPVLYDNINDYLDDITGIKASPASFVIAEQNNRRVGVMIVSGAGEEMPCYAQYEPIEGRSFVDEWQVLADQCYTYYTSDGYDGCNMIDMCVNMMRGKGWEFTLHDVQEDVSLC